MKKLVLFFAVAFAMSFAACSSKTTSDATSADSTMVDSISVVEETVIVEKSCSIFFERILPIWNNKISLGRSSDYLNIDVFTE